MIFYFSCVILQIYYILQKMNTEVKKYVKIIKNKKVRRKNMGNAKNLARVERERERERAVV